MGKAFRVAFKEVSSIARGLTIKQQRFADEYIRSGNITQAAIKAGYSGKTAYQTGAENLKKPRVKAYIDAKMAEIESHKIADAKEVLQYLNRVLRGDETEEVPDPVNGGTVERKPLIKDRTTAAREIMKRYPLSDPVIQAQLRKLSAEADLTEEKVKVAKQLTGDDNKKLSEILDKIEDGVIDDSAKPTDK